AANDGAPAQCGTGCQIRRGRDSRCELIPAEPFSRDLRGDLRTGRSWLFSLDGFHPLKPNFSVDFRVGREVSSNFDQSPSPMKCLIPNIGSTSFKFRVIDMPEEKVLVRGRV